MIIVSLVLGALGLVCLLSRTTLPGALIGIQLIFLGAETIFVVAGSVSGIPLEGHLFGLFIIVGGAVQVVVGHALAIRLFYLKKGTNIGDLKGLRH